VAQFAAYLDWILDCYPTVQLDDHENVSMQLDSNDEDIQNELVPSHHNKPHLHIISVI
jgi:hypothetical protein